MDKFEVMEPTLDPSIINVNGRAVVVNVVLLYSFALVTQFVPILLGVSTRGFFCDDDSIRYEYRSDTVSTPVLMAYNLILCAISVLVVELYRIYTVERKIQHPKYRWRSSHIHVLFVRLITYFGYSQIGFVMNVALNTATKHTIGRLRPHFLAVCQPNVSCTPANAHEYIIDYECMGDPMRVLEARKSFYSGHSAISLYCAVWSALYIQARLSKVIDAKVIIPVIQTVIIGGGLFISLSRITDNKHHWSDVLVGILVGTFFAVYTCVCWCELFKKTEDEELRPLLDTTSQLTASTSNTNQVQPTNADRLRTDSTS